VGIDGPRSPAVHRGARVLDAISSGAATTPATLCATLGLPKSSIADLLSTLLDTGFITRGADGDLRAGARWSDLSDPDAVAHRLFRACATTDLDGHTVSLTQLFGNQVVFVDVRPGRHPLPLTPRPGQRASAAVCAGAVAILSSMAVSEAANAVWAAASHLGLSDDDVRRTLALRHGRRRAVYESLAPQVGRQLACAVTGTRLALTLHVPERWPEPATRKAARALAGAAEDR
jgi:IclR family transcriptional regulator, blcABC operon repressor